MKVVTTEILFDETKPRRGRETESERLGRERVNDVHQSCGNRAEHELKDETKPRDTGKRINSERDL